MMSELRLNGIHQLPLHADNDYLLGRKHKYTKKNNDTITLNTIKEVGLDAAAINTLQSLREQEARAKCKGRQTTYTFMSLQQNAEQNHDINTAINHVHMCQSSN